MIDVSDSYTMGIRATRYMIEHGFEVGNQRRIDPIAYNKEKAIGKLIIMLLK